MPQISRVPDYPCSFRSPESSNVKGARYDPDTLLLVVEFNTGKEYGYSPVPEEMWVEFLDADSKGKFFSSRIRPFYVGRAL